MSTVDVVGVEVRAIDLITLECWREERMVGKTERGDQASVGCKEGTPYRVYLPEH